MRNESNDRISLAFTADISAAMSKLSKTGCDTRVRIMLKAGLIVSTMIETKTHLAAPFA